MFVNLHIALDGSLSKLVTFDIEALGQIYDLGELGDATITCAGSEDNCFRPTGCRCYESYRGLCSQCGQKGYYCKFTGYQKDICGMFEIPMLDLPWAHAWNCPYR